VRVRNATPADLPDVYSVCLQTADDGDDATSSYVDPALPGHVWAGAYVTLEPRLAFVLDDVDGVAGYVLGALDTADFARRCDELWWPPLRRVVPDPTDVDPAERTADERAAHLIHHPITMPRSIISRYPSHLHIDLLPRAQGAGNGRRLLATLLSAMRELGSPGVHLGVSATNTKAIGFYRHLGWETVADAGEHGLILGRRFDEPDHSAAAPPRSA
jgi:ribosomal protein S18 acetylase RimI-like enzyme